MALPQTSRDFSLQVITLSTIPTWPEINLLSVKTKQQNSHHRHKPYMRGNLLDGRSKCYHRAHTRYYHRATTAEPWSRTAVARRPWSRAPCKIVLHSMSAIDSSATREKHLPLGGDVTSSWTATSRSLQWTLGVTNLTLLAYNMKLVIKKVYPTGQNLLF
jgi:hypothetical protein